jgi:hypothetical protein
MEEGKPTAEETAPVTAAPDDVDKKEKTEVKTLQQMAVEQGAKLPKSLTPEQLHMQLLLDHHMGSQIAVQAFKRLSQRGKDRLWTAIMQLPHADLEVALNGKTEKELYLAAQKVQMAKHAIMFNKAKREHDGEQKALAEKLKKKQDDEKAKQESKTEGVTDVGPESATTANQETQVAQSGEHVQSETPLRQEPGRDGSGVSES